MLDIPQLSSQLENYGMREDLLGLVEGVELLNSSVALLLKQIEQEKNYTPGEVKLLSSHLLKAINAIVDADISISQASNLIQNT